MARFQAIGLLLAGTLAATPAIAEPPPVDSWGRANVDLETYRKDSIDCGLQGYYADVSQTRQAKDFVRASRQMEAADNSNLVAPNATGAQAADAWNQQARQYEQIRQSIRPEKRMQELKRGMTAVVEQCLIARGYVRFRLTPEQGQALSKLRRGSDERRAYLHGLATNPDVLKAQAVVPQASSSASR